MQAKPQYQEVSFKAPFLGPNVQTPEIMLQAGECRSVENFIFRNSELSSAPKFKRLCPAPVVDQLCGLVTFLDSNNVFHTLGIGGKNVFQLIRDGNNLLNWNLLSNFNPNGTGFPVATTTFLNSAFWTTGTPGVYRWDGMAPPVELTTSGNIVRYGGFFMMELGYHLILLNTVEYNPATLSVQQFPQRVRWCASGLPNVWEPSANPNAGFTDQFDVPDLITGGLTIGRKGYIFRSNGISEMTLTGNGQVPFNFDHLWASNQGIGNVYPQTIANYGTVGMFVSSDQVYSLTSVNLQAIGGKFRDQIVKDLQDSVFQPLGCIVPGYTPRYVYLTYNIFAYTRSGDTKMFQYNLEDKNWTVRRIKGVIPTCEMGIMAVR